MTMTLQELLEYCGLESTDLFLDSLNPQLKIDPNVDGVTIINEQGSRDFESGNTEYFSVVAPATDYDLGTGDFGIALNVNRETAGTKQVICGKYLDATSFWMFYIDASNLLRFHAVTGGTVVADITGTTALSSTSAYYHLAVMIDRDSAANTKLYVDGVDDTAGTPTVSATDCTLATAFEVGRTSTAFVPIGNLSFNVQTTGSSETFDLIHPLTAATAVSFDVDWGDGNVDTGITSKSDPLLTHTYADAGTYTININGTLDRFKFENGGDKLKVTAVNRVQSVELGCTNWEDAFFGCLNLTTIATGMFDGCTNITTMREFFANCPITTLPDGLFNDHTSCTDWTYTFSGCSALSAIPNGLLHNIGPNPNMFGMFQGCTSLTSVPTDLFDGQEGGGGSCTWFFGSCTGLTSVPEGFWSKWQPTSMAQVFQSCTGITTVPDDFFDYHTTLVSVQHLFAGCPITWDYPVDMFTRFSGTLNNIEYFFSGWNITEIKAGLLDGMTLITSARDLFKDTNITSIPAGLFDDCPLSNMRACFSGCSSLTAIPENLLPTQVITTTYGFYATWINCTSLETIPADLFSNQTNLGDNSLWQTFASCSSLTNLPSGLFDGLTNMGNGGQGSQSLFSGCSNLATVPANLFDDVNGTNFASAFNSCALTETSVDNILQSFDAAGESNGTINITGGTSSAPSATGDAAVTSLQGKGWTVTTN